LSLLNTVYSQEKLTKIVIDGNLNTPLSYSHIYSIKSTTINTVTNLNGEFTYTNSKMSSDTMEISHLGYAKTKLSVDELIITDTIRLYKQQVELDEIVLYDYLSIMEKVKNNIDRNYPNSNIKETFFHRYFSTVNNDIFQRVESLISTTKEGYFKKSDKKTSDISLMAKSIKQNDKLEGINYLPYTYNGLISVSNMFLIIDENYECSTENISTNLLKITFESKEPNITKTGKFTGHLIIDLSDYAIVECYYSKLYSNDQITNLKKNYTLRNIKKTGLRKYEKDPNTEKYFLKIMVIEDEAELSNTSKNTNDTFKSNYLLQNINGVLNVNEKYFKRIRGHKKSIIDYKEYNAKLLDNIKSSTVMRTKEQEFDN